MSLDKYESIFFGECFFKCYHHFQIRISPQEDVINSPYTKRLIEYASMSREEITKAQANVLNNGPNSKGDLTRGLRGWKPPKVKDRKRDYKN